MELILLIAFIPLIAHLFWQSYLLSQYKKLVDEQADTIKKLKPF